jgi:hypothetical protein
MRCGVAEQNDRFNGFEDQQVLSRWPRKIRQERARSPQAARAHPFQRKASPVRKCESGNPRGPHPKNLPALLIEALDEPVPATTDPPITGIYQGWQET